MRKILLLGVSFLSLGMPASASAQDGAPLWKRFTVNGQVTLQHVLTENRDLGTSDADTSNTYSAQPRLRIHGDLTDKLEAYGDFRALLIKAHGGANVEDDAGRVTTVDEDFLEVRQYWLRYNELFGEIPLHLQIGRQRFSEPRTIWWNRDLDAVSLRYDSTLFEGVFAVGQNIASYRTSDGDYLEDDKQRLRVLTGLTWQYELDQYIGVRALYEKDHSGAEQVGSFVNAFDRDEEDFDLLWFGGRLAGERSYMEEDYMFRRFEYAVDLMGVTGEEDIIGTSFYSPNTSVRRVSSVTTRDVFGWGLDASVNLYPNVTYDPVITLGYAFGSGDENMNDDESEEFRQTGLQGNSNRMGVSSGSIRNYGEVLRPELSNLHIWTLGAGVPLTAASDMNLFYHAYYLDEYATTLRSGGLSAGLNGTDKYVGQGADLVFNINLSDQFGWDAPGLRDTRLKLNVSGFEAGDAYGTADGEKSLRVFSELQVRF